MKKRHFFHSSLQQACKYAACFTLLLSCAYIVSPMQSFADSPGHTPPDPEPEEEPPCDTPSYHCSDVGKCTP